MTPATLVVPVYNEALCIRPVALELDRLFKDGDWNGCELLFVDDGSIDGTDLEIKRLKLSSLSVRLIRFRRNQGKSHAVWCGIQACKTEKIVILDGDGQVEPADVITCLEYLNHYDAAFGYRLKRADGYFKYLCSRLGNTLRNKLAGESFRDAGSPLKGFHRKCLQGVQRWRSLEHYLTTHVDALGFEYVQFPMAHRPRLAGKSKYNNMPRRALIGLLDIFSSHNPRATRKTEGEP